MQLPTKDADHFWELMWQLQLAAGHAMGMLPAGMTREAYAALPSADKLEVRDALFATPDPIVAYVERNPDDLPPEDLAVVAAWQHAVGGDFVIERYLKKCAVFIGGDHVYGVLGLYDAFDVFFQPRNLPVYVRTILLPYKGQIVYDGVLQSYRVLIGGNMARGFKETYMAAKQAGMIITSLEEPAPVPQRRGENLPDLTPIVAEMQAQARKLRSSADAPPTWSPAFGLLRASLELAEQAVAAPDDTDALWRGLRKIERAMGKLATTLDRAARYR